MSGTNGTTTGARRGRKPTKTLAEVKSKVALDEALDPVSKESAKARKIKVQKETADLTIEKALSSITAVRVGAGKALDTIVSEIQERFEQLKTLDEFITVKQEDLEQLHDKDVVLSATAELVASYEEKRKQLEAEQGDKREVWSREQTEHDRVVAERRAETERMRKREQDDYNYNLQLARKKDQDTYEEQQRLRTQAEREKQDALNKNWQQREEALAAREADYNRQKTENESLPDKVKAEVNKEVAIVSNKMKRDHDAEVKTLQLQFDSDKRAFVLEIDHLKKTSAEQGQLINQLQQQLEMARKQAQDLALKAMEAQSGQAVVQAVKDMASGGAQPKQR